MDKQAAVQEGLEAAQDSQRSPDAGADKLVDAILAAAAVRPDITKDPRLQSLFGRLSAVLSDTGYEDINEQVQMQRQEDDVRKAQMADLVDWIPSETGTTTVNGVSWSYQAGVPCRIYRAVPRIIREYAVNMEKYGQMTQRLGAQPGDAAGPIPVNLGRWDNNRG